MCGAERHVGLAAGRAQGASRHLRGGGQVQSDLWSVSDAVVRIKIEPRPEKGDPMTTTPTAVPIPSVRAAMPAPPAVRPATPSPSMPAPSPGTMASNHATHLVDGPRPSAAHRPHGVKGAEEMSSAELAEALRSGARVVAHRWAISLVFVTFYLATRPTYIAPGRRDWRALAYSLLTLVCGWWGIPWGRCGPFRRSSTTARGVA